MKNKLKVSRKKEIIKMRAEISEIEQQKKIYETKSQFLKRAAKMTNAYQLDDEEKREEGLEVCERREMSGE